MLRNPYDIYCVFPIVSNEKSVYIFLYIFYCETMAEIVLLEELVLKIFFAPQPWWGALLGIFIFS